MFALLPPARLRSLRRNPVLTALMVLAHRARHRREHDHADRAARDVAATRSRTRATAVRAAARQLGMPTGLRRRRADEPPRPDDLPRRAQPAAPAAKARRTRPRCPASAAASSRGSASLTPFMVDGAVHHARLLPDVRACRSCTAAAGTTAEDRNAARVVVISRETHEKLFGGEQPRRQDAAPGRRPTSRVVGVLDNWKPTPRYYHLIRTARFGDAEEVFLPFAHRHRARAGQQRQQQLLRATARRRATRAWLESECVWIQFWVELKTPRRRAALHELPRRYVAEQKKLGRFPRPLNNRLRNVMEWLEYSSVVSRDARTVGLARVRLPAGVPGQHGRPAAREVPGPRRRDRRAPRARRLAAGDLRAVPDRGRRGRPGRRRARPGASPGSACWRCASCTPARRSSSSRSWTGRCSPPRSLLALAASLARRPAPDLARLPGHARHAAQDAVTESTAMEIRPILSTRCCATRPALLLIVLQVALTLRDRLQRAVHHPASASSR